MYLNNMQQYLDKKIQKYPADNGAFNTRVFKESTTDTNQTIAFSGVDAHHQNVIAERMIKTVTFITKAYF